MARSPAYGLHGNVTDAVHAELAKLSQLSQRISSAAGSFADQVDSSVSDSQRLVTEQDRNQSILGARAVASELALLDGAVQASYREQLEQVVTLNAKVAGLEAQLLAQRSAKEQAALDALTIEVPYQQLPRMYNPMAPNQTGRAST